jgi:hypothetical protein
MEATSLTAGGWPLLSTSFPPVDATKTIQRPGTSIVMFRTAAAIRFVDGLSDIAKQGFFTGNFLAVLGVTSTELFFVSFSDPGTSITEYDARLNLLRSKPEVLRVMPVYAAGFEPADAARFPTDSMKRVDWFSQTSNLWAMRAIRAPLGWGCETGTYSSQSERVKVGLVEWVHDRTHPEFAASTPRLWTPSDAAFPQTIQPLSAAKRDTAFRHAVATGGLLTASGDNNSGMAGVSWRTDLTQYSLRSPQQRPLLPSGLYTFLDEVRRAPPRILNFSINDRADSNMSASDRSDLIDEYRLQFKALLDDVPLSIVVAAGNERARTTVATYVLRPDAGFLRSALLLLRIDPQYSSRIIVVAGTIPGNNFWNTAVLNSTQGSNSFDNATDIAAPAEDVGTIDTVRVGMPVGYYQAFGTSLSAPMVAGAASLLLAMDSTLTPSQVKDYLIRGAQVPRNDSLTGAAVAPSAVNGVPNATIHQLDLYGALTLLSKERAGTPICGYPVLTGGRKVFFLKNGYLNPPTDSFTVPAVGELLWNLSIKQGGRELAVWTYDSLTSRDGSISLRPNGTRIQSFPGVFKRIYLERDIVNLTGVTATRIRPGSPTVAVTLTYADGSPLVAGTWDTSVSPDGRFVTYTAVRPNFGRGLYVKRFSDSGTELIYECMSCHLVQRLAWNHDGRVLLASATIYTSWGAVAEPWSSQLMPYSVSVNAATNAFTAGLIVPVPGRVFGDMTFSGDDAILFAVEGVQGMPGEFVKRPAAAMGSIVGSVARDPYLLSGPQIGNLRAGQ